MQVRRVLGAAVVAITVGGLASSTTWTAVAAPSHPGKPKWAAADRAGTVRLAGQVPLSVAKAAAGRHSAATLIGAHQRSSSLTLNFALPLRHRAALDALIKTEAKTHHYLSRAALYARFSPPQAQLSALRHWLTQHGYKITHVSRDRTAVAAKAATSTVARTLGTRVNDYVRSAYTYHGVKVPAYRFYSNTASPRVPARLGVSSISGLTDIDRFFTNQQLVAGARGQRGARAAGPDATETRAGGYFPLDLRSMYDVSGHGIDATGQTIGFTLWGAGERQTAMTSFATGTGDTPITVDTPCVAVNNAPDTPSACTNDQPAANHLESILENGNTDGSVGTFEFAGNVETALDIEQAHGMSPGSAMKYYLSDCSATPPVGSGLSNGGCNGSDVGMEEAVEDAANDPHLHTVSNSWGYGGETEWGNNDPFKLASETSFAIAAAAGTTFWFSTGDFGTYFSGYPSDSPYVAAVGGTSLFATSNTGTRSTATTWAAGGSWCSNLEPRPSWQNIPAVTATASCSGRVIPDVSAIADTNTAVRVVASTNTTGGTQAGSVGGTSVAAPEMNGMAAMTEAFLAQQTYGGAPPPPLGFEAPMLYQLGTSSHYGSYFYDVVCGNTANPSGGPDGDAAGAGWDPATGWGEIDWFNYSTGYAIALGATGLSQPASIATHYAYTCAQTPTNAAERAVSLPTKSVGYSVGAASNSTPWPAKFLAGGSWGAANNFLKTTDGGSTWQAVNSDMMSIACTSASTCTEVGDGGRIRRTTDGGSTWTYVSSPDNKALTSIACPSSSVCYAAGDRGAVLKSTNAGASWAYVNTADGNPIYGLSCPSATICYAVDNYAHVEKTINGGSSWTLSSTPITTPGVNVPGSGGPNPFSGLFGITCTTINKCVAVGGFPATGSDAPIVTTTDGGNTWTLRTSNSTSTPDLNGVACVGSTCYAVGRAGVIVTSTDGGVTWAAMTSNTTAQLTGITCLSATSCVATGQGGAVDVLSSGTWTPTTALANGLFLASVVCRSATDCVAAGKQGATLAFDSTNVVGSATVQAGGGTTQQMNGLSCVDATHCVGVGNAGTIITTSDGGQTWRPRTSGTAVNLAGVSCAGSACEAVGAATGGAGTILRSVDGGVTWAPQTSGTSVSLTGVTCHNDQRCVAVGGTGTILGTVDGGTTWTPATSGTTVNLAAVTCAAGNCYAVGATAGAGTQGAIVASTDGGVTWTGQASNSAQSLTSIACTNDVACFAGGAIGTVVTTVDGGATWTQQGNPISGPTSALNAGPTGITAVNGAACTSAACVFGTASAGDIMVTPLLTVTVNASGKFGNNPLLTNLDPDDSAISYSPADQAGNVTGTLTCSTTATATSDPGSYPVSECSGLSDPGFSVVYDLDDSSYTVGKADQTITFPAIDDMTYGDAPFTPNATASSGLDVQFGVTGNCELDAGQVVITRVGSCTVTASQPGNVDYNAAPDVSRTFQIAKADQTITFGSLDPHTFGDATFEIDPTASSGLTVSLSATGSCTLDSNTSPATVTITGAGTCSITASQAGNDNYNAAPDVTRSFDVAKANQTITFGSLPDRTFNDAPFTLDATASSGLDVSYGAAGQCTVSGNEVTITGAGSCTITASQEGDNNYNPASDVSRSFDIAKDSQTITFPALDDTTINGGAVTVSATASSGLTVLFSVSGDCTISGHDVQPTGVGSCTVTASQAGDSDYLAAPNVSRTFQIGKGDQTITFESLGNHALGSGPVPLGATASSGLPVSFTSDTPTVCSVVGSTVVLNAHGTCTIEANQAGNDDWNAAPTVTRSFTVTKATPVVHVSLTLAHPEVGKHAVIVTVLATAAPTPTGSVKASAQGHSCTVLLSGGTGSCALTFTAGSVDISATYSGDGSYKAATGTSTVQVGKATPSLSLSIAKSAASGGKHKLTVTTTVHGRGTVTPTGTVAVKDGKGDTCTVHLSQGAGHCSVTVSRGTYTISAHYGGDSNYVAVSNSKSVTVH